VNSRNGRLPSALSAATYPTTRDPGIGSILLTAAVKQLQRDNPAFAKALAGRGETTCAALLNQVSTFYLR